MSLPDEEARPEGRRPPVSARPWTEDRPNEGGGVTITMKRCCNGCGRQIGDVTREEVEAAICSMPLPDVRRECGCYSETGDCSWCNGKDRPGEHENYCRLGLGPDEVPRAVACDKTDAHDSHFLTMVGDVMCPGVPVAQVLRRLADEAFDPILAPKVDQP